MNAGHLYMALALASYSILGVFHKLADVKHCRPSAINALLYFWSLVMISAFLMLVKRASPAAPGAVLHIALPFGVCSAIAILALQAGIRHGNIATSWLAINLSAGIPTLASILIYHEPLNLRKGIALVLIVVSMILLWKDKRMMERS